MKYIGQKSLLTLFIIGIIAASCSKDSQNQYGDDMTYLPISDLVIHPLGDVVFVSYTSESEWIVDVDVDEDWIHFSSENGAPGTTTLNITVDPNIDMDRDAVITFWSGDKKKALDSFVVTQKKAVLDIDISQHKFDLGWKKEDQNFTVESNIQWEILLNGEDKDKFDVESPELDKVAGKIDKDFKTSEEVVTFGPNANNLSDEEDEAEITVAPVLIKASGDRFELNENVKKALTTTISISQDYLIFLINDSRDSVTLDGFSELGKKYVEEGKVDKAEHVCSQKFTVVSEMEWKFDEAALADVGGKLEEVAVTDTEKYGRDAKEYTMILHMDDPNPTREVRPYDLKLWAVEDEEASRTVKVKQNPYVLSFDADTVSFVNVGEPKTLMVNTTGPWKIENKPEWLTVKPSEGVDTCEVTIKAPERNLNFENLTETLKLTSLVPEVYYELPAKQDAFIFKVDVDEALHKMSRLDTKGHEVEIISSGPWELVLEGKGEPWLEIPGIQLDKNGRYYCDHGCDTTIVIKANSANPDTNNDRDMTCLIRSTLHKDSGKEWNGKDRHDFDIKQERFRFEILTSINDESDFTPQSFASYRSGENTQSFYLKCSAGWKITSDENWLTFDKNEGSGEEYCTISMIARTNAEKENRKAIVTVSADVDGDGVYGDKNETFDVHQDGFVFEVTSSVATHTFGPWKAEEVRVDVNTVDGAGWEVEPQDDYVKINKKMETYEGKSSSYFTFGPKDNGSTGLRPRDVTVIVRSKVSEEEETITYKQAPYEFDSTPVTLNAFDEISSNNSSQPVEVECSGDWTLENVPEWLEIKEGNTKVTKGSGNATLSFKTVMNNVSLTSKNEATVQVVSKVEDANATHTKNIKVSQNKYTWEVDGMGGITLPYDALDDLETHEISVKSSGKWEFSFDKEEDDKFFTLGKKEGGPSKNSPTEVELNVKPNYTLIDRKVTITLKSEHVKDNPALTSELVVNQEAYVYNVPDGDIEFEAEGGTENVTVECSGGFDRVDVSSDGGWLSASISNGNLKIEAKSNDSKGSKAREGKIIIQSKDYKHNEALKTTIKVTQDAKKK